MEIINRGRSLMTLAVVGMAVLALSLIPVSTAEAGTKPHTLRGIAHGQTVELHWKEPSSPTLDGDSKYRYVVFRREVSSTTTAQCQLPLETDPARRGLMTAPAMGAVNQARLGRANGAAPANTSTG